MRDSLRTNRQLIEKNALLKQRIKDLEKSAAEHKRTKEALEESGQEIHALFDQTSHFVAVISPDGARYRVNRTVIELAGVKEEDCVGRPFWDAPWWPHSPELRKNMHDAVTEVAGGKALRFEVIQKSAAGGLRYVDFSLKPVKDELGKITFLLAEGRDITERKQAEEELIRHRESLEVLVRERTAELEKKRANLEELNTALSVLLRQREKDKDELEEKVLANIKELVMPYIHRLKKSLSKSKEAAYVDILEANFTNIISPFSNKLSSKYLNLTPKEIQIANLIKEGKTTKEIAELLNISPGTTEFHRKNIRIKLNLKNKKDNLRSYLLTF